MNLKKILVLLLFLAAIACIIAPVEAKIGCSIVIDSLKPVDGKTTLHMYVVHLDKDGVVGGCSNSAAAVSKRKAEFNNVNKIVISINGYKKITFKKPAKGWKLKSNGDEKAGIFEKKFKIKGDPKKLDRKKNYTIKIYNKKNKLIGTDKDRLVYEGC